MRHYGIISNNCIHLSCANLARYYALTMFMDPFYKVEWYNRKMINSLLNESVNSGTLFLSHAKSAGVLISTISEFTSSGYRRHTECYIPNSNTTTIGVNDRVCRLGLNASELGFYLKLLYYYKYESLPNTSIIAKELGMGRPSTTKYLNILKSKKLIVFNKVNTTYVEPNIQHKRELFVIHDLNIRY